MLARTAARMARTYLVSDTRERSVLGLIKTLFDREGAAHTIAQINTGDYLVCRRFAGEPPEILACIERKTLADFAASFKDGRYENRLKMLDLRDRTGCQLYFFVEGPAFPKPTRKVARIPYGSILSAMTNMMLRDGIHVVQTENELGTAQRLLDFVLAFGKAETVYSYPTVGGAGAGAGAEAGAGAGAEEDATSEVPPMVLGLVEKSDDIITAEVWAKLAGISLPTAQLVARAFSVADLVGGRVSAEALGALRTAGGRQIAKKGKASLASLQRGGRAEESRVLAGVPGLSPAMAAQILGAAGGLARLLAGGVAAMAAVKIRQRTREVQLGAARSARISRILNYTPGDPPGDPPGEAEAPPNRGHILGGTAGAGDGPAGLTLTDGDLDELLGGP